jgi:hypothetical protein
MYWVRLPNSGNTLKPFSTNQVLKNAVFVKDA